MITLEQSYSIKKLINIYSLKILRINFTKNHEICLALVFRFLYQFCHLIPFLENIQTDKIDNSMDIEEPTPNRLSNCSSKNQVNFFRNSIKSRLSNDSLLSFPEFYDSKSEQKMSLESNISQKIRREENSKGLFDQLLDQNEMNYNNSRGYGSNPYQFKNRGSDLESMINESQGASRMSIEEEKIQKITCKCSKSKCLLMYCECFSKGLLCNKDCSCYQCRNNENFEQKRQKARMSVLEKDPHAFTNKLEMVGGERVELANKRGCNCKKTRCFKKYCECFNAGVKCTYLCNCENCLNGGENVFKEQM